jgi:putative PIN family toxin of toxin-antitoxin system
LIRVLFDTNVLLSAILFGGLPGQLLSLAKKGTFRLITSLTLLDELYEKLRYKFRLSDADLLDTRTMLENLCEVVSTVESLHIIKDDPDDDRVLECAVAGRADYIISGDKHLLRLGEFRGIRILTIRQFMDLIAPPA